MESIPWIFDGLGVYIHPDVARVNFGIMASHTHCFVTRNLIANCLCQRCLATRKVLDSCVPESWFLHASLCSVPGEDLFYFGMPGPFGMDLKDRAAPGCNIRGYAPCEHETRLWLWLFKDYVALELNGGTGVNTRYDFVGVGEVKKIDRYKYGFGGRALLNIHVPVFYDKVNTGREEYIKSVGKFNAFFKQCGFGVVSSNACVGWKFFEAPEAAMHAGMYFTVYNRPNNEWLIEYCTDKHVSGPRATRFTIQGIAPVTLMKSGVLCGVSYELLSALIPIKYEYLSRRVIDGSSGNIDLGEKSCSHSNKRQVQCGIGGTGDVFWYCPDCKKEV